jgi:hypothetical protein
MSVLNFPSSYIKFSIRFFSTDQRELYNTSFNVRGYTVNDTNTINTICLWVFKMMLIALDFKSPMYLHCANSCLRNLYELSANISIV